MSEPLKIMPVEQVGAVSHCMAHPSSYAHDAKPRWSYADPSKKTIAAYALQRLEAARATDVANHEKNLAAIENNKLVRQRVEALMAEIGMPARWSQKDTKSRSRFPKSITMDSGYLDDLRRNVKTDDGFSFATMTYERLKTLYQQYAADGEREAEEATRKAEREQQRQKAERRANIEMASIILRYSLDIDADWFAILEHLRGKDQRLDLALAMQATRGDWSEGFYRVRDAFDRFTIETTEDKDIANDIVACLATEGDCRDGRVFRDTRWSYDALFASISDQQLVADAQLAYAKSRGDE
ncbi:hypothetical protein [Labrys neptuniae]